MPDALLVDAAVLIDHLRDHPDATRYVEPLVNRHALVLHPVVLAEVLNGARNARHLRLLEIAMRNVRVLRIKPDDFVVAVDLLRAHRLASGIDWPDCLIAATALRLKLPVVTTNDKHFGAINTLSVIRPY